MSSVTGSIPQVGSQITGQLLSSFAGPASGPGAALSGAAVGGIAAGVGIFLGIGMSLLAAHDQRYKNAKTENEAVAVALSVFDEDIRKIIDAANHGTISADEAIQYLQETSASYWQYMGQFKGPGISSQTCGPMKPGGPPESGACYSGPNCVGSKTCTAGCCIGCNVIEASILNAIWAIQNGGGQFRVCETYGNKYGLVGRSAYNLTYAKPDIITGTQGALEAFFNSITGKNTSLAPGLSPPSTASLVKKGFLYGGIALGLIFFAKRLI